MEESVTKTRVLTCYYKFKQGGLCTRLLRAINALLESGNEVHILAVESFPITHPNYYFHKFRWPFKNYDSKYFWFVFMILSPFYIFIICAKHKITHLFAFDIAYAFVMQFVQLRWKLPLSIFYRADSFMNHKIKNNSKLLSVVDKYIEKIALREAKLFFVSNTLLNTVRERNKNIYDSNCIYFPNDIKIENVAKRDVNCEIVSLSCVGVYEERKNQLFLIQAMQQLKSTNWELHLYGDGPLRKKIEKQVKSANLENKILLKGWVVRDQVWKNTDLLLMPSQHEGAPNAILEALGNGIPILASDIPEHREILSEKYLYGLDDSIWATQIDHILEDVIVRLNNMKYFQRKSVNAFTFDWNKIVVDHITRPG